MSGKLKHLSEIIMFSHLNTTKGQIANGLMASFADTNKCNIYLIHISKRFKRMHLLFLETHWNKFTNGT